jgi:hypothetical protein
MIPLMNLPDGLLKSTIADHTLELSSLIQEALRREMRVEISVNVVRGFEGAMKDWSGIGVSIRDKEKYNG